jgi:hypothetical protein
VEPGDRRADVAIVLYIRIEQYRIAIHGRNTKGKYFVGLWRRQMASADLIEDFRKLAATICDIISSRDRRTAVRNAERFLGRYIDKERRAYSSLLARIIHEAGEGAFL